MRTNIDIDDNLITHLMELGNYKTKKEAVNEALQTQVNLMNRRKMADLFGKIDWEGDLEEWRKSRFPEWDGSGI